MAIKRITIRYNDTKLYDIKGGHVRTVNAGEFYDGSDAVFTIPNRGSCYGFDGLYVQITRATLSDVPITDPVPPPPSDEYILYVKDGITRKFVPE